MTISTFAKISNQITVRSDQFNVYVTAQRINDVDNNGIFETDKGDTILANTHIRALLDRSSLTEDDTDSNKKTIFIIEKENL